MVTMVDIGAEIREMIRLELDAADTYDAAVVAAAVVEQINPDQFADALAWALARLVQNTASGERKRSIPHPVRLAETPAATVGPPRSARWESASRSWRHLLETWESCFTPDGEHRRVRLGDMTADELRSSAAQRRELAASTLRAAGQREALADAMDAAGAARVRDLDEGTALGAFTS